MKRGRRIFLVLLACGVVAVVTAIVWPREREPEYQGKKVSEWIAVQSSIRATPLEKSEARKAIGQIGTNALPYFLGAINYVRSPGKEAAVRILARLPLAVARVIQLPKWAYSGERRAELAVSGFEALGPAAAPALPELGRLLRNTNGEVCISACSALVGIGEDSIPTLAAAVADPTHPRRALAAGGLRELSRYGTNASAAVPLLVACLADRDDFVAAHAAEGLGKFALEPEVCVPVLLGQLDRTNAIVRRQIIRALGGFGARARAAAPRLVPLLNDPKVYLRVEVTNALRQIAPEMLEDGHLGAGTNVGREGETNVQRRTVDIEH